MEKCLEKIESENSDRADITSDIVTEESDVPKKPKRNRGKKKKNDREDDKNEEKATEPIKTADASEIPKTEANISESKSNTTEPIEDILSNAPDVPIKVVMDMPAFDVVPQSEAVEQEGKQKKKNKKKKRHDSDRSDKSGDVFSCTTAFQKFMDVTDQKPEDTLEVESEAIEGKRLIEISTVLAEDKKGPNAAAEEAQETILPGEREVPREEIEEFKEVQKHESRKKKHKKDKKFPPKTEDFSVPTPVESPKIAPPSIETIPLGEIVPDQLVTPIDAPNLAQQDFTEILLPEKSEPLLEENICVGVETTIIRETVTEKDIIDTSPKVSELEIKDDNKITKPDSESPKPKAKIAKPVDKKRKGKQDTAETLLTSTESAPALESVTLEEHFEEIQKPKVIDVPPMDIILDAPDFNKPLEPIQFLTDIVRIPSDKEVLNLETNPVQDILKPIEQLTPVTDVFDIEKEETKPETSFTHVYLQPIEQSELTKDVRDIQESEMAKEISEPNVIKDIQNKKHTPSDNKPGKKKRKPLKMPMPPPINPEPIKSLDEISIDLSKEGKDEIGAVESIFETLVPTDVEVKVTDEKLDEIFELKVDSVKDTLKTSPETTNQPEEKWTKPKRKGKKSIKKPPTPGIRDEPFSDLDTKLKDTEECSKEAEATGQAPTETLEIRSMKADDSECSPCDVTPDIVYPRSTSQHNIDDNNNTLIREITVPDTLNLPVGLTTPLIQGSGETPVGTPIMVSSFNITEIDSTTEKTDIKSKMVEVNRDMEELRKSIERSLAEFTAMEKSEDEIEKKYEKEHKLELNTPDINKNDGTQTTDKECKDLQRNTEISKDPERIAPLATQEDDRDLEQPKDIVENEPQKEEQEKTPVKAQCADPTPVCPARRDNKGKGKKKKGKQDTSQATSTEQSSTDTSKEKREEKTEQKTETKEQSKQETKQKDADETPSNNNFNSPDPITDGDYDPIENFEDALTSSVDDVNKTFEMILNEVTDANQKELASNKPDINITAPEEDFREGAVPQPKNLLGHPDIPVSSNKDDFKKEKHKTLNTKQAKVKIKDANDLELKKDSKQSQTENRKKSKDFSIKNSNENGDFIYKYSFRKVFLQNSCHVCAKDLASVRVACNFCNLLFYCSIKHKDEDWPQHQALCFAISTIVHLKDQKHIYAEAKNITGQNYRLLRMQMILSCEKVLKRRLVPWEQEALLYPRICADIRCREWRQSRLKDCEGCGQISYCANELDHLPRSHQRWCKSYALYQKLVTHQQTKGRLEPKLPTKVMTGNYEIPEKINEVLASMYEEQIDNMNDIQYAALTQIATAPLTVVYSHQLCRKLIKPTTNGILKKSSFVIHVLGAELQFEADVLNKWEVFFLHLRPDVNELVVVLISNNLNPGNLPLELLGKIRLCDSCREEKRRVIFSFQDKKSYPEYRTCDDFIYPDIVCAFNASINRSSYSAKDQWPGIITSVMRLRSPFLITSHTPTELHRDLIRIKECGEVKVMVDPRRNSFASVRPDRNFITDDETPLLFKNQCFAVLCGV